MLSLRRRERVRKARGQWEVAVGKIVGPRNFAIVELSNYLNFEARQVQDNSSREETFSGPRYYFAVIRAALCNCERVSCVGPSCCCSTVRERDGGRNTCAILLYGLRACWEWESFRGRGWELILRVKSLLNYKVQACDWYLVFVSFFWEEWCGNIQAGVLKWCGGIVRCGAKCLCLLVFGRWLAIWLWFASDWRGYCENYAFGSVII